MAGFDELMEQGIISDYNVFKWKGAEFDTIENSGDRIAGFTIQADSVDELQRNHQIAVDNMRVLDENGNDIMRHDLLPEIKF